MGGRRKRRGKGPKRGRGIVIRTDYLGGGVGVGVCIERRFVGRRVRRAGRTTVWWWIGMKSKEQDLFGTFALVVCLIFPSSPLVLPILFFSYWPVWCIWAHTTPTRPCDTLSLALSPYHPVCVMGVCRSRGQHLPCAQSQGAFRYPLSIDQSINQPIYVYCNPQSAAPRTRKRDLKRPPFPVFFSH